jgi:hypothetical protein
VVAAASINTAASAAPRPRSSRSRRLAQEGYEVKVYSGAEPGLVRRRALAAVHAWDPTEECDLLVVSRMPHVFDNPIGAKRTALWCHDHSYPGALTEERAEQDRQIVVLSDWQRDRFAGSTRSSRTS